MKKLLRIVALILILGTVGFWFAAGANRGWTRNEVEVRTMDEITGIEGITYENKFVPGVDFLALSVGAGILLAGLSFLFRTKPTQLNQTDKPKQQLT